MPPITAVTARRAFAAGLTATAALALTAGCHDGYGTRADAPATAVSPAPAPPAPPDGGDRPGPGGRVACTPEMLRFHAGALPHPAHRMLLTVTNDSDRTCDFAAQGYPLLRFGDDRQPAIPAIEDSRPPSVVALAPRATAYATITTSADGGPHYGRSRGGRKISQFGVALTARAHPTQVGLDDRAPVPVDPHTAKVTYWQTSLAAARKW
ncbi:DUF4232 domain-containing protein [Streptomyces sp. NPDC059008]|uniref:DUF4232 domain-containing protein n=1 Tax=Streptomyces sp. NPDC059008 TaxID=3346693 RepID=UPI0036B7AEC8